MTPRRVCGRALVVLAALGAGWLLAGAAAALASAPAVLFASESCDVGSVVQGEQPACDFTFTNAGTEVLHVLRLEPSCGCTTALLSSPALRAGERGTVHVVFDSSNFAGEVVKEIEFGTDDPARPTVTLRVKALVEPEIDFEPRVVTFEGVRAGELRAQTVMVTNRRAEAVRIVRLEAQPASCSCAVPAWVDRARPLVLESWDRVPLEVRFSSPQSVTMPIAAECLLSVEGPRKRDFRLRIFALPAP